MPIKHEKISDSVEFSESLFKTLITAYKPYLKKIIFLIILGLSGRLMILGQSNIIGKWVDNICIESKVCQHIPGLFSSWESIHFLTFMLITGILGFLFTALFRILFSRYSAYAVSSIYDRVTFNTSRFPMRFFDENPTGRVVTRFSSDYGTVFRLFGGPLAEFIAIIFDLVSIVLLLTIASPFYLIGIVIIGIINFIIYKSNITQLRAQRRKLSSSRSPSIAHFAETTQGASTIRILGKSKIFSERFSRLDSFYIHQKLITNKLIYLFSFQMNSLSSLLLLLVGVGSYYLSQNNLISMGSIGVAFGLIVYSGNTIQMFFEWLAQLEEGIIGLERIDNYLHLKKENGQSIEKLSFINKIFRTEKDLVFLNYPKFLIPNNCVLKIENLSFRYADNLPWVLKNINFTIKEKEKIGIIGRTGSGKTSLIQAIFAFYPIEQGRILINDQEAIKDLNLAHYRRHFSYISQEPILFLGTIKSNLDPLNEFSDSEIMNVLFQVGYINELISAESTSKNSFSNISNSSVSEKKWNSVIHDTVEEKGKNLSLGERQLLCLARTLLNKAPIVILDEATSSVDPQSEELMVKATEDYFKDRTQIIIAHRLSTLEKCDRIIWINKGSIYKIGPAHEIIPEFENFSN